MISSERRQSTALSTIAASRVVPIICLSVVLLLRAPSFLLEAQFWAEDGFEFFARAFNQPSLVDLIRTHAGYLALQPRLVALLSLPFGVEWAPTVFNVAAFAFQMLPLFWFLSPRSDPFLPTTAHKLGVAALYVACPGTAEIHVTITNSQWILPVLVLAIIYSTPPRQSAVRVLEYLLIALAGFTGPFVLFVFLAYVATVLAKWARRRTDLEIVLAVCCAAQITMIARNASPDASSAIASGLDGLMLASGKLVYSALLGTHGTQRWLDSEALWRSVAFHVPALVILGAVLALTLRTRNPFLLANWILSAAIIAALVANRPDAAHDAVYPPGDGLRYTTNGILAFVISVYVVAIESYRSPRRLAFSALLLASITAIAIPMDFDNERMNPDLNWRNDLHRLYHPARIGERVYIPINPPPYEMKLVRKKE